ncbi:MAG: JAB domain-containing protein [Thermotogaceae bacterium]|nr:JAB domain-containing protein [Thermotogaceae bacterium]
MVATKISWKMIREESYEYFQKASEPLEIYGICSKILESEAVENMLVVSLDTKLNIVGITNVGRGILDSVLMHAREVFRPAILANAAAVILVHNHPSGDPTPSRVDREVTVKMQEKGAILGIRVLDHVIIGDKKYWSYQADREFYAGF